MAKRKVIRHNAPRGKLIGWKWAEGSNYSGTVIIKLEIPAHAHVIRSNARYGIKYRASEAKVLEIHELNYWGRYARAGKRLDVKPRSRKVWAQHYELPEPRYYYYYTGKIARPHNPFDQDVRQNCGSGIHFFLNRKHALAKCFG